MRKRIARLSEKEVIQELATYHKRNGPLPMKVSPRFRRKGGMDVCGRGRNLGYHQDKK